MARDDSVYYSSEMSQYMHTHVVMPDGPVAKLERAIDPALQDLTFKKRDGTSSVALRDWFGYAPPANGVQWDCGFEDGVMSKLGKNGQGIYVDLKRAFCAMGFATAATSSGIDHGPGYMRAAAKALPGG